MHAELSAYFLWSLPAVPGRRKQEKASHKFAVGIIFNLKKYVIDKILSFLSFLCTPPTYPLLEPQMMSYHFPNTLDSFVFHDSAHVVFLTERSLK